MPVAGLFGSDLPAASDFRTVRDPYSGAEVYVIPRLAPDFAVLHVHEADAEGNARVFGTPFWDRIMSRAADRLIITAERIVPTEEFIRRPELTLVPGFLVAAVVEAPGGAWPGACWPDYAIDEPAIFAYLDASRDPLRLAEHLGTIEPRRHEGREGHEDQTKFLTGCGHERKT
jgi:glutaconate CoA-transferase, subunit A